MKTLTQYREDVKNLLKKINDIETQAQLEARDFRSDEIVLRNEMLDAIEEYEGIIKSMERKDRVEQRMTQGNDTITTGHTVRRTDTAQAQSRADNQERFPSFGHQLVSVVEAARPGGRVDPRLFNAAASGMSEAVTSDGGFLVQQDFTTALLQETVRTGVLAPLCRQQPISGNSNAMTINGVDETSRVSSRFGGIIAYWADEAEEKTKSKPKFRQIELKLKKLVGLCYATDELLSDAAALEGFIRSAFPSEFRFQIDDTIVNGTGAGQPLGILNSGCLVTVAKEAGQKADTIVAENVIKMSARIFADSFLNARWYINQMCLPQLYTMSIAVGTGGQLVFVPPGGLSNAPYGSLLGRPVVPIEHCSALGDLGDIVLADMNGYILAQKGGIQADVSIHVRFVYDESVFRFVLRVDGQPVRASALTPYKGGAGATLSHFVTLAERA